MANVPNSVKNMTGVDITQQLSRTGLTGSRVGWLTKSIFLIVLNFPTQNKETKYTTTQDECWKISILWSEMTIFREEKHFMNSWREIFESK